MLLDEFKLSECGAKVLGLQMGITEFQLVPQILKFMEISITGIPNEALQEAISDDQVSTSHSVFNSEVVGISITQIHISGFVSDITSDFVVVVVLENLGLDNVELDQSGSVQNSLNNLIKYITFLPSQHSPKLYHIGQQSYNTQPRTSMPKEYSKGFLVFRILQKFPWILMRIDEQERHLQ